MQGEIPALIITMVKKKKILEEDSYDSYNERRRKLLTGFFFCFLGSMFILKAIQSIFNFSLSILEMILISAGISLITYYAIQLYESNRGRETNGKKD